MHTTCYKENFSNTLYNPSYLFFCLIKRNVSYWCLFTNLCSGKMYVIVGNSVISYSNSADLVWISPAVLSRRQLYLPCIPYISLHTHVAVNFTLKIGNYVDPNIFICLFTTCIYSSQLKKKESLYFDVKSRV